MKNMHKIVYRKCIQISQLSEPKSIQYDVFISHEQFLKIIFTYNGISTEFHVLMIYSTIYTLNVLAYLTTFSHYTCKSNEKQYLCLFTE